MSNRKPSGKAIALGASRAAGLGAAAGARALARGVEALFFWIPLWVMSLLLLMRFLNLALVDHPQDAVVGPLRMVCQFGGGACQGSLAASVDRWLINLAGVAVGLPAIALGMGSVIGACVWKNGNWFDSLHAAGLKLQGLAGLPSSVQRSGPGAAAPSLAAEIKGSAGACLGNIASAYAAVVIKASYFVFAGLLFVSAIAICAVMAALMLGPVAGLAVWALPGVGAALAAKSGVSVSAWLACGLGIAAIDAIAALAWALRQGVKKNGSARATLAGWVAKKDRLASRLADLGAPAFSQTEKRELGRDLPEGERSKRRGGL